MANNDEKNLAPNNRTRFILDPDQCSKDAEDTASFYSFVEHQQATTSQQDLQAKFEICSMGSSDLDDNDYVHLKSSDYKPPVLFKSVATPLDGVNMRFWYNDQVIHDLAISFLITNSLVLSNEHPGVIINYETEQVQRNTHGNSLSYCPVVATHVAPVEMQAKLNVLEERINTVLGNPHLQQHEIIIPINVNNNHWCLGIMSIARNQAHAVTVIELRVYDSLHSVIQGELIEIFNQVLAKCCPSASVTFIMVENCKRQLDGSACGVIVAENIRQYLVNGTIGLATASNSAFSHEEILQLRKSHMQMLGLEYLQELQTKDIATAVLTSAQIDRATPELAQEFAAILQTLTDAEQQAFITTAQSFVSHQQNLLTSSAEHSSAIMGKIKQELTSCEALESLAGNFLTKDLSDGSWIWIENGIDNLTSVLESLIKNLTSAASKAEDASAEPHASAFKKFKPD